MLEIIVKTLLLGVIKMFPYQASRTYLENKSKILIKVKVQISILSEMENNSLFVQILGYIFYGQSKCKMRRSFLGLTASKSTLGIDPPSEF
jgi:hypothetical protein